MQIIPSLILWSLLKIQDPLPGCSPPASEINIAQQGIASQSSQFDVFPWANASLAIDGQRTTDFFNSSCTHTDKQMAPWWRLDLKKSYNISTIRVFNRNDCCQERLMLAHVRIGDSPNGANPSCGMFTKENIYSPAVFCCNGMEGQYVHILIPYYNEYLSLCEVEVYAVKE
ncbi:pentraxin fusion protein-like [Lissotriton helveticus]